LAGGAGQLSAPSAAGNAWGGGSSGQPAVNAVVDTAGAGGLSSGVNSDLAGLLSGPRRGVRSVSPHTDGGELDAPEFNPLVVLVG
jgi:hypothetical protein